MGEKILFVLITVITVKFKKSKRKVSYYLSPDGKCQQIRKTSFMIASDTKKELHADSKLDSMRSTFRVGVADD